MEAFLSPWTPLAYALELRHNPNARYRVLLSPSNELIGYSGIWIKSSEAYIVKVAVAPAYRKSGWGSFLVEAACNLAQNNNASDMFLEVRRSNEAACSFYQTLGFSVATTLESYYTDPVEDAYLLHKPLKRTDDGKEEASSTAI
jgi:ribosomal-protein-alanine N-acetyltransferase